MARSTPLDVQRRRLYALKRAPALRHTSNTVLLQLLELAWEVSWAKDTVLCEEGQEAQGFFLLLEGELEAHRDDELLLTLRPGTPLGFEALVGGRYTVTARAATTCKGLFFPRDAVWNLVQGRAGLRQDLKRLLASAPRAEEEGPPQVEVVAFDSQVRGAPLSRLIALMAKVISHDFKDRVLLVRPCAESPPDAPVVKGADGVLRTTVPVTADGAPGRLELARLRDITREHDPHYVFLDGCDVDAPLVDKEVRLVSRLDDLRARRGEERRVLPTVVIDPRAPPRGGALGGEPHEHSRPMTGLLPSCVLRLELERLERLELDARPLSALGLERAERAALSRWARALTHRRVGLALSGGGVWGFYHVHILRWLVAHGVPVDFVSSSSMGSLVGAYFCGTALDGRDGLEGLAWLEERAMGRQLSLAAAAAFVTTYSLERFVAKDLGDVSLEELPIRFLPVTTDLTSGDCVALERGPVARAVRASGSAPGIWAPTMVPPARYVDGAFTSMVPASVLVNAGADLVFSSNIFPFGPRETAWTPDSRMGRFLAGLDPVARVLDLVASGVLLLHRNGDAESLMADVSYDIQSADAPLLTAMEFTKARDILRRAAGDEALQWKLEELKAHWRRLRARCGPHGRRGGRRQAA
ncbi:patatin-like phospholipase family protein [Myxococcus sp. K15C18031901]|uniref:patatin-like phospholipase family protein n=1 Tax=Myxococcus dinghuensis TaxID=2906761 RepID=UPI0020A7D8C7|nr:patatin-like phospholipase family protein [Myxococcus dinghuensis]MCP3105014.1 patatin-like phospholipase family protein [Myxococcus dinghuensis]